MWRGLLTKIPRGKMMATRYNNVELQWMANFCIKAKRERNPYYFDFIINLCMATNMNNQQVEAKLADFAAGIFEDES